MDIDTRAPSPASDTIEEAADPPWPTPQNRTAPAPAPDAHAPQSSSERDQTDVTCNLAALAGLAGAAAAAGAAVGTPAAAHAFAFSPASASAPAPASGPAPATLPPPLLHPHPAAAAPAAAQAPASAPVPLALAPAQAGGVHVCSNCNVAQSASTTMSHAPHAHSQPSGSPSLLASIGLAGVAIGRPSASHALHPTHGMQGMSPPLLPTPATPFNTGNGPTRAPSPSPSELESEVRHLRGRLKDLETLSARLHGQLESSQQRLFKERAHHETIAEMWATRVGVLEGDNQKLRARLGLGDKPPVDFGGGGGDGHRLSFGVGSIAGPSKAALGMGVGSGMHSRRTSKDVNSKEGKKRSPSSDPRRGTPPRHIDIDPPSMLGPSGTSGPSGSGSTPKASPRCQDVCPIQQCAQQLVVGQERP